MHDHHHSHAAKGSSARSLGLTAALTGGMMLAEFAGGWWSNSLALISDAGHMFTDVGSLLVSLWALKLAQTPPDTRRTFGWQRAEILAALFNGVTLLLLCSYIAYEAIPRFLHPEPIQSKVMMVVALAGLLVNVAGFLLLRKHSEENLNIRGALLHVLGDLLSSVAVLGGGLLIWLWGWTWLDPVLSLLIAVIILHGAYRVTREALGILLEFAPAGVKAAEVESELLAQPGVAGVHHLHVWSVSSSLRALSAHVVVDDQLVSATRPLLENLQHHWSERFGIGHATLQFEHAACFDQTCPAAAKDESDHHRILGIS
jgi:cobalt-zinc-cadmium efflux system protein